MLDNTGFLHVSEVVHYIWEVHRNNRKKLSWSEITWEQILALLLIIYVPLSKLFNFSGLQYPYV